MYYYNTLLVLFTGASLCVASPGARGARVGLQKLKDRTGSGPSSQQPELKRDATPLQSQSYVTVTQDSITDITTEYAVVTSYGSEAPVVVTKTIVSQSTIQQPAPPSPTSTSEAPSSTSQVGPAGTSAPSYTCQNGFFLCAAEFNGGCCGNGYTCAIDSCIPPPTATGDHLFCDTGLYLCPANLQYGCCPGGYDCGISECSIIGPTAGVSSTLAKASALNLLAKHSITTASPSSTPTSTPGPNPVSEISPVTIGGIVAGCLVGIAIFVFLGWYTYRRVGSRGNNDPPGGVTTTNYYDPTASVSRTPGSSSSARYHTVTQDHGYFPKMPFKQKTVPSQALPPQNGVVEMAHNTASYPAQHGQVAWGNGNHNHVPVELPALDRQEPIYEVEGTKLKSANRWTGAFSRQRGGR